MTTLRRRFASAPELLVILAVVLIVGLLVLPLPAVVLDLLITVSIAASLVVLLVSLDTRDPLDFSVFPTLLLLLTLFRLGLNVSSTRLILGEGGAGKVIGAFGGFVVGGNYAVGIVIFLILVAINFIVITKGAGRVAEVAARFTLDAMPGRQMSIDADLNAGLIDDAEAKRRREEISAEADFYGSMDGAAKFVRGDAIAGLIITGINIIGGIVVGVVQRGMSFSQAVDQYTVLTVGDGLVSQIPALIVSTAAGIIVTHSAGGTRIGAALTRQLGVPQPLWAAGGILFGLALVPALPATPFLLLSAACGGAAFLAQNREEPEPAPEVSTAVGTEVVPRESPVQELLQLDPVELEVGYGLIPLVDQSQGGDLLERVRLLRKQAALELGLLIPPIRIRDDVDLGPGEYVIRVRGSEASRGELMQRRLLALDTGAVSMTVDGVDTRDPSFDLPAKWIAEGARSEAEARGWMVVDPGAVLATHLMEVLKGHASELLGRQDVQEMIDTLKETQPALVDEVVPARITLSQVHRVLQRLLKERVPIRDLVTILEAMADHADTTKDPESLTEHVRRAMGHVIAEPYTDAAGMLRGITIGPRLEAALMGFFSPRARTGDALGPQALSEALRSLDTLSRDLNSGGQSVPLITPPSLRIGVRRLLEPVLPSLPVLSLAELPPQANLTSLATWELNHAN